VFANSFVCANGVAEVLPVDVEVPGNPPPPLAILHGLLVAAGRKPPQALTPADDARAAAVR
jgi:Ni,Fe-hydrogenase III small subunit